MLVSFHTTNYFSRGGLFNVIYILMNYRIRTMLEYLT